MPSSSLSAIVEAFLVQLGTDVRQQPDTGALRTFIYAPDGACFPIDVWCFSERLDITIQTGLLFRSAAAIHEAVDVLSAYNLTNPFCRLSIGSKGACRLSCLLDCASYRAAADWQVEFKLLLEYLTDHVSGLLRSLHLVFGSEKWITEKLQPEIRTKFQSYRNLDLAEIAHLEAYAVLNAPPPDGARALRSKWLHAEMFSESREETSSSNLSPFFSTLPFQSLASAISAVENVALKSGLEYYLTFGIHPKKLSANIEAFQLTLAPTDAIVFSADQLEKLAVYSTLLEDCRLPISARLVRHTAGTSTGFAVVFKSRLSISEAFEPAQLKFVFEYLPFLQATLSAAEKLTQAGQTPLGCIQQLNQSFAAYFVDQTALFEKFQKS